MGKKDRSFASKVAKSAHKEDLATHCSVCGEMLSIVHVVSSEKSDKGTWRFREKFVGVCKCNQKEVYA